MAIIKYNAIHTTPKKHLRYILNPDKNEQLRYVTGICCNSELDAVYADFKDLFEMYDDEKYALSHKHDGKNHIRIHSYVQSFSAGEVTPEQAHKIGVEWCKAMFGEERPVIITTHTNTDHVHNHIAVCPYDIYGEKWKGNKTTLKLARTVSDRICLEHGLSVIKDPKKKSDISYAEWLAIRDNRSWKVKMADDIDRYIHDPSVRDIPSLVSVMKANGYEFTDERKLIAKPKGTKHAVSIYKLGHGYRYSSLKCCHCGSTKTIYTLLQIANNKEIETKFLLHSNKCRDLSIICILKFINKYVLEFKQVSIESVISNTLAKVYHILR
jgi:hypothetical protein